MTTKLILATFGLLSMLNCKSQKTPQNTPKQEGETVQNSAQKILKLEEGKTTRDAASELNIKFIGISQDSRCPTGVECVWQGVALAEIEVMSPVSRPQRITLATMNNKGKNYSQSAIFDGYKITLKEVLPYPSKNKTADNTAGHYTIGVAIAKIAENETGPVKDFEEIQPTTK